MQSIHPHAASPQGSGIIFRHSGLRHSSLVLRHSPSAAALIIVLAFVVLLAGLVIAFFSRAVLDRQISNSSASQSKAELFALGAADQIIGDLKQEIVAGSTSTATTGGTIYAPKTGTSATIKSTMMPDLVGSTGTGGLENLIKRSASGRPFYDSANSNYTASGASRAASVNSATNPSLNNRSVSTARWNKPLLMRKATETSDTDFTPVATYTAPDWVLVARDGTNPTAWNTNLIASSTSNTTAVTGRYAYNIYDEGGLLDMNAAGYPDTSTSSQKVYKHALAYADLTQLKDSAGNQLLTGAQINSIVGWRNYASASIDWTLSPPALSSPALSGGFPLATSAWTTQITANYYNYTLQNTKGYLTTANPVLNSGQTDRLFTSRKQLMKLLDGGLVGPSASAANRATIQNALQYLTHFSRDVNQPAYSAASNLATGPKVKSRANGGNDAGDFSGADVGVNPPFLTIRATSGYTRNDGSVAKMGEPLMKQRFALNRLAWLTYEGPSSDSSAATKSTLTNAGVSTNIVSTGNSANIQNYFGLRWNDTTKQWTYIHGANGSDGPIMSLAQVATAGRDPDFFEIIKASVVVGSMGKAYAYTGSNPNALEPIGYQQQLDNSVDAQIMQIGVNIIDQYDFDGYPTRVLFADRSLFGGTSPIEYRGVEDLPYLYRIREGKIMTRDSDPPQSNLPLLSATLVDSGEGVVLQEPEIWNPHAKPPGGANPRPTSFRLVAVSTDPVTGSPTTYTIGAQWRAQSGTSQTWISPIIGSVNTTLTFDVPTVDLFREPTLLIKPNIPTGSNLAGPAVTSLYPARTYAINGVYATGGSDNNFTGVVMGTVPMAFTGTFAKGGIVDNPEPPAPAPTNDIPAAATSGIAPTGFVFYPTSGNVTPFPFVTYRLQCRDAAGAWVTYDEKYTCAPSASSYNTPNWNSYPRTTDHGSNKTFYKETTTLNQQRNIIGSELAVLAVDPRSSRFGMIFQGRNGARGSGTEEFPVSSRGYPSATPSTGFGIGWATPVGTSGTALQNAAMQNALMTTRPDENQGFIFSTYDGMANGFAYNAGPTAGGWSYPAPSSPGGGYYGNSAVIRPGLLTQNNPAMASSTSIARFAGDDQGGAGAVGNHFFADADGVVRRAMSAFVPVGTSPALAPATGFPSGLPLKTAYAISGGSATGNNEVSSRPIILNRPFRSIAELGNIFSGTPWRNLDFSTPESGSMGLLDAFCLNDSSDSAANIAGKVNLNTRQSSVLRAILVGAYQDEMNPSSSSIAPPISLSSATAIADILVQRTHSNTSGMGPLANISELVGRWNGSVAAGSLIDGSRSYVGFGSDMVNNSYDLGNTLTNDAEKRIQRFRESSIRALVNTGQTRTWNLLIDLVAQTGRYPQAADALNKFIVEGEQRYWIHLAIDRLTGTVIDKQIEVVKE